MNTSATIPDTVLNRNNSNIDWRALHLILRMRKQVQRYCLLRIIGTSMEPTMREGDIVTLDLHYKVIMPGDIVVFPGKHGYGLIIHRVLWRKGDYYWIKGDNALRVDIVHRKDILGVVCENALHERCALLPCGRLIYGIALFKSIWVAGCAAFLRVLLKKETDHALAWYINKRYQAWLINLIYAKE